MKEHAQYRRELDAAVADCDAALTATCVSLLQQTPQRRRRIMSRKQFIRVCLAVLLLLALLTFAAIAGIRLLSPREVALTMQNDAVAALFETDGNAPEPQTVTDGDYTVTLLGVASAERLVDYFNVETKEPHSYAVLCVGRTDGAPVTPEEGASFLFLPLISGYEPTRLAPFTMTIGRSAVYLDGLMYTLVDMIDLTPFADRALWLLLMQSSFPTADVVTIDANGDPVYTDGYTGTHARFRLPVDPAKADAQKAAELLRQIGLE